MTVKRTVVGCLVGLCSLGIPAGAAAAPGDLDPRFGVNGRTQPYGLSSEVTDMAWVDGRLVVVGYSGYSSLSGPYWVVGRLAADGKLDPGFGEGGLTREPFGYDSAVQATAIASGATTFVVAADGSRGGAQPTVVRYSQAGRVDTAFGKNGVASLGLDAAQANVTDIALDGQGRSVVTGISDGGGYVVRLTQDGAVDLSFGEEGLVKLSVAEGNALGRSLALSPDGSVLVGAAVEAGDQGEVGDAAAVFRLLENGQPDPGFGGGDGVAPMTPPSYQVRLRAIALQNDGAILLTGLTQPQAEPQGTASFVSRITPSGDPDLNFGTAGHVIQDNQGAAYSEGVAVTQTSAGQILLVGTTAVRNLTGGFLVTRLNADGTPDRFFGFGGSRRIEFLGSPARADAMAIRGGKVTVGGESGGWPETEMALSRLYLGAGESRAPVLRISGTRVQGRKVTARLRCDEECALDLRLVLRQGRGNAPLRAERRLQLLHGKEARVVLIRDPRVRELAQDDTKAPLRLTLKGSAADNPGSRGGITRRLTIRQR